MGKVKFDEKRQTQSEMVGENVEILKDGTKKNISEELKKEKMIEGLQFTNMELTRQEETKLVADITNISDKATEMMKVEIIFLGKNGEETGKIEGIIPSLEPGKRTQFSTSVTIDYVDAQDFQIVKK